MFFDLFTSAATVATHVVHRFPVFPEYNVGLALLRLGKIMTAASGGKDDGEADSRRDSGSLGGVREGSAHPAVDCRVVEGEELRRCLPLTPPWWPVDLDPTTGKVPS